MRATFIFAILIAPLVATNLSKVSAHPLNAKRYPNNGDDLLGGALNPSNNGGLLGGIIKPVFAGGVGSAVNPNHGDNIGGVDGTVETNRGYYGGMSDPTKPRQPPY